MFPCKKDEREQETVRHADKRKSVGVCFAPFCASEEKTYYAIKKNKKKLWAGLEISPNIRRGFSTSTLTVSRITVHVIRSGKAGGVFCSRCKLIYVHCAKIPGGFDSTNGTIANPRL